MSTFKPVCIVCQQRLRETNTKNHGFAFDIGQRTLWIHHKCLIALLIALIYGSAEEPNEWEVPVESNTLHIN